MSARRVYPDPPAALPEPEPLDQVRGLLRDPSGTLRRVLCSACQEYTWTRAKRHNGRCSPCRRTGRPASVRVPIERACLGCGRSVLGKARRLWHAVCRAAARRRYAKEWYTKRKDTGVRG